MSPDLFQKVHMSSDSFRKVNMSLSHSERFVCYPNHSKKFICQPNHSKRFICHWIILKGSCVTRIILKGSYVTEIILKGSYAATEPKFARKSEFVFYNLVSFSKHNSPCPVDVWPSFTATICTLPRCRCRQYNRSSTRLFIYSNLSFPYIFFLVFLRNAKAC